MGLLEILEGAFLAKKKTVQVDLKEIFCKRKDDGFIRCVKTSEVGCEHTNADGSQRQKAIQKLKPGQKVRLIWDSTGGKDKIYLLKGGGSRELALDSCFGRLNDKAATDVVGWLTKGDIVTSATVLKITGGTKKKPKLGCVLELRTYPAPKGAKSSTYGNGLLDKTSKSKSKSGSLSKSEIAAMRTCPIPISMAISIPKWVFQNQ